MTMQTRRPFPTPEDFRRTNPGASLARAGAAHLKSFITGHAPLGAAKMMFGEDPVTAAILKKSATSPATMTQAGWAQEIARVAIFDLIQSITSLSAGAAIIYRGLQLSLDGIVELRVPGRTLSAAAAGQWVGEGQAAPVRALGFSNAAILQPRKLQVISVYTREMAESSNIENVVKQTLGEATGLALDVQMFSANAASANAPAGLFANVAPLTPTAVTGSTTPAEAAATDIGNLFGALAAVGGGKTAVIVAAMPQATRLKMIVGPKFDYDILASTALAPGTVVVIEVASFVSGFGSTAEFEVTKVGAVHMEDTSPTQITGGSPSPAVPTRSLFQIDALALKTNLWASFGMRAAGHVQYLTGANW